MQRLRFVYLVTFAALLVPSAPASAQMDFSGEWAPVRAMDNTENPYVGDWFGLPPNEAGRARAEAWDASIISLPEWQPCAGAGCAGLTAPSLLATIASPAPPKPISYVINTHLHTDHTGGNAKWRMRDDSLAEAPALVEPSRARAR